MSSFPTTTTYTAQCPDFLLHAIEQKFQNEGKYIPPSPVTESPNPDSRTRTIGTNTEMSNSTVKKGPFEKFEAIAMEHIEQPKAHQCQYCPKSFSRVDYLNKHIRTHTGERPFSCEVCQKRFIQQHHLNQHQLTHINEEGYLLNGKKAKTYTCDECDRVFTRTDALNVHKRVHSGIKPYSCSVCSKAFTQLHHLTQHKTTHSEIRQYSCSTCRRGFKNPQNLRRHEKNSKCTLKPGSFQHPESQSPDIPDTDGYMLPKGGREMKTNQDKSVDQNNEHCITLRPPSNLECPINPNSIIADNSNSLSPPGPNHTPTFTQMTPCVSADLDMSHQQHITPNHAVNTSSAQRMVVNHSVNRVSNHQVISNHPLTRVQEPEINPNQPLDIRVQNLCTFSRFNPRMRSLDMSSHEHNQPNH